MHLRSTLPFGRALALGLSQLGALAPSLTVFGANAVAVVTQVLLVTLLVHQLKAQRLHEALAVLGGIVAAWLIAQLLRALALGGAVAAAADRLAAQPPAQRRTFLEHAVALAQESLGYALLHTLLHLLVAGWRLLAFAIGAWLYLHALASQAHGVPASAAVALAVVGGAFLGAFVALWTEVALVRAVHHRQPYSHALVEALEVIGARPWSYLGVFALTGLFAVATEVAVATIASMAPRAGGTAELIALTSGYGQLLTGLIVALAAALFELARLYCFTALSLDDSGELPTRPSPPPLPLHSTPVPLSAELIIDAEPVEPRRG